MHNPHIDKVSWDMKTVIDTHIDELAEVLVEWEELITADGQSQVVPIIHVWMKV